MFGNTGVIPPNDYILNGTKNALNSIRSGSGDNCSVGFNTSDNRITSGKGFAAGLGVEARANGSLNIGVGTISFDVGAGAEFHLLMLDYGPQSYCFNPSTGTQTGLPIGFNGNYLTSNITAWAIATGKFSNSLGSWNFIIFGAVAQLNAGFPYSWAGSGR